MKPTHEKRQRPLNKIAFEEKGQRAARSTDVYQQELGPREVAICKKCRMLHKNKRWVMDEGEAARLLEEGTVNWIVCPACQRMADGNAAGIVTFSGRYLLEHEDEILNAIKRTEAGARAKNPLARIMEINQDDDVLTISTTDDKLAQKLGRDIYKAHSGELHYSWSHDLRFVRVNWSR